MTCFYLTHTCRHHYLPQGRQTCHHSEKAPPPDNNNDTADENSVISSPTSSTYKQAFPPIPPTSSPCEPRAGSLVAGRRCACLCGLTWSPCAPVGDRWPVLAPQTPRRPSSGRLATPPPHLIPFPLHRHLLFLPPLLLLLRSLLLSSLSLRGCVVAPLCCSAVTEGPLALGDLLLLFSLLSSFLSSTPSLARSVHRQHLST